MRVIPCLTVHHGRALCPADCPVCLTWPRSGSACALSAASTIDYVCAGDEMSTVLDPGSGIPVPGGVSVETLWSPQTKYCQWVRWASDDTGLQTVYFSIKDGTGRCARRSPVDVTVRGVSASCNVPRTNPFNGYAGCAGNDDVDNECLWSFQVPRPGGPGWTGGEVCVDPPAPAVAPGPPPPRRRAPSSTSKAAPPLPPDPPPPSPPPPPKRSAGPGQRMPNPPAPPSKSPPAPSINKIPFPFCACKKRNVKNTPYRLVYQNRTNLQTLSDGKQRVRHCFNVDLVDCDSTTACCGMSIKKIGKTPRREACSPGVVSP